MAPSPRDDGPARTDGPSRRSLEVDGFAHVNPIPAGTRIGPLLVSSVIAPFDPGARTVPASPGAQIANLFAHAGAILEAGGATWDDVAKMTFFVPDLSWRDTINEPWAERFPDPASRPSRHTQVTPPTGGRAVITCDLLAYVTEQGR